MTIAQALLDRLGGGTYLEIGVDTGVSFIPIRARRKWGVDPGYTLTRKRRFKYAMFSLLHIKIERLFRVPSDDFFDTQKRLLRKFGIDVCFVDGLHTYEQSLRDVTNALEYLNPGGVILVHDCNPGTKIIATPADDIQEMIKKAISGWTGAWSGDVWKTIVNLRSLRSDVEAFVLDCDAGVGVVKRGRGKSLGYSEREIAEMDYHALDSHREEFLGLKPAKYFAEFVGNVTR